MISELYKISGCVWHCGITEMLYRIVTKIFYGVISPLKSLEQCAKFRTNFYKYVNDLFPKL